MNYVFHRGEYIAENQAYIARDNRAFRFGDGCFESIRVVSGVPIFLEGHYTRACETLRALRIEIPPQFTLDLMRQQIQGLLRRNQIHSGGRVRMTLYRKSTGFYLPKANSLAYYIEAEATPDNQFNLSPVGKNLDIFTDLKKDINRLSVYKTLNTQVYVMAALHAQEKGLDDALIQNHKMALLESTSSNFFIVSNGVLYTPMLQDGCVGGTMRMNVINLAIANQIKVYECTLNPQNLLAADEMFLTNAVRGIEWVSGYRTKRYYNQMSRRLVQLLNDKAAEYADLHRVTV
jgi:branched-subunit amino acid aminotransferase/4-amino-4-deoxychorismate lyase